MIKPEEVNVNDSLAIKYGLTKMVNSTPLTIDTVNKLALVEVLKPGERPEDLNGEEIVRRSCAFSPHYGIYDAEYLFKYQYKIPWEARADDALILFPGAVLGLGLRLNCYRAMPAFYFYWGKSTGEFFRQAFWYLTTSSLSRGYFLVPSP